MAKNWRPERWDTGIIARENLPMFKWETEEYAQMIRGVEAGFDACLEALKQKGKYILDRLNPNDKGGWLCFIPDEEAD